MKSTKRPFTSVVAVSVLAITLAGAGAAAGRAGLPPLESKPCTRADCVVNLRTSSGMSHLVAVPKQTTTDQTTGPGSPTAAPPPARGVLNKRPLSLKLVCPGYTAADPDAFQFYLGSTTLGGVIYKVTDTVTTQTKRKLRFCFGWVHSFTTASGAQARSTPLPNGAPGFIGLLPQCTAKITGPCLDSVKQVKSGNSFVTTLTAFVPAIPGDPWMRA